MLTLFKTTFYLKFHTLAVKIGQKKTKAAPKLPPSKEVPAGYLSWLIVNSVGGWKVQVVYTLSRLQERGV